jgi:hypothetical protein
LLVALVLVVDQDITCRLVSKTLCDLSLIFEIDMPALRLARIVLQCEGEDRISLLDGLLALGFVRAEDSVDQVESFRGGKRSCRKCKLRFNACAGGRVTVFERHVYCGEVWRAEELDGVVLKSGEQRLWRFTQRAAILGKMKLGLRKLWD